MTGLWFSPGTLISSINKTDDHDIIEILLKVALNTIHQNHTINNNIRFEGEDIHYHSYLSETDRTSCDISDKVRRDLHNGRYCFIGIKENVIM